MPAYKWGGSDKPILTFTRLDWDLATLDWSGPYTWFIDPGPSVSVVLNFLGRNETQHGSALAKIWIEKEDGNGQFVRILPAKDYPLILETKCGEPFSCDIPFAEDHGTGMRFRIRAQIYKYTDGGGERWEPLVEPEVKYFQLFRSTVGRFSVKNLPVTILYCPPCKGMTNTLIQNRNYGTVITLGTSPAVKTTIQSTVSVPGGVTVTIPYFRIHSSQSTANVSDNTVVLGYDLGSSLVADTERAISDGHRGSLGDIFVVLSEAHFYLVRDASGISIIVDEDKTRRLGFVWMLPAHELLRPLSAPAQQNMLTFFPDMPAETRRRILALDPFITNLDDFFPVDREYGLSRANTGYTDHYSPDVGLNRAALVATYVLGTGVIEDWSSAGDIKINDENTNELVFFAEAEITEEYPQSFDLSGDFLTTDNAYPSNKALRVGYQASMELRGGYIWNARCFMIHNEEEPRRQLKIWWDKQFSTYMFRVVQCPQHTIITVNGKAIDPFSNMLNNVEITLRGLKQPVPRGSKEAVPLPRLFVSTTDDRGHFQFAGVDSPGEYELQCGDMKKTIRITAQDIEGGRGKWVELKGVKRVVTLADTALWELAAVLDLPLDKARTIQLRLQQTKPMSSGAFEKILHEEKLSATEIYKRAVITFAAPLDKRPAKGQKDKRRRPS